MTDSFSLDIEERGKFAILRTSGYVNNLGGEAISDAATALIAKGINHLVLNFEKSNVVNSIGISILIEVIEDITDAQGQIAFCFLTRTIAKTFNIMGLTEYANVYPTEEEAIQSMA